MRRLFLLAVLLCAPSVAHADDLYLFTPWYGCTSGGTCFTATGYTPLDLRQGPTALVTYLTCTPSCTPINLMWSMTFYDEHDQALDVAWYNSGDINFAPPATASYGVLDVRYFNNFPDGTPDARQSTRETVTMHTTPEPETWVLMGTGLLLVLGLKARARLV